MRHTLTDPIIDRDKCAVRFHGRFDCPRQELRVREESSHQIERQVGKRFVMLFRNKERVTGKNRTMVEKGERNGIFEHDSSRDFVIGNLAKGAVWVFDFQALISIRLHRSESSLSHDHSPSPLLA